MKEFSCKQGSCEWWTLRRGIPTASEFSRIITAKTMKDSAARNGYIAELIGELSDPRYGLQEGYVSDAMARGTLSEPDARDAYAFHCGEPVRQVGFCLSDCGRFGCSPDGLVGDDGGLELKCPGHKAMADWLLRGSIPDEYMAQVHGCMVVTGRKWWDFMAYSPNMPPLIVRAYRNEFTEALAARLETFDEAYNAAREVMSGLGWEPTAMEWIEPTEAELEAMTEEAML